MSPHTNLTTYAYYCSEILIPSPYFFTSISVAGIATVLGKVGKYGQRLKFYIHGEGLIIIFTINIFA